MTPLSLDDAWAKLRWAEEHLATLKVQMESFRNTHRHRIVVDKNLDQAKYMFRVEGLATLPESWGLIIGDCVHNARTSLDFLMVNLVARSRNVDPASVNDVDFPIYKAPRSLNGHLGELRKDLQLSGYLAPIEHLQPYNLANPSIWGTLTADAYGPIRPAFLIEDGSGSLTPVVPDEAPANSPLPIGLLHLSTLDNIDKHRVIHKPRQFVKGPDFTGYLTYEEPYERLSPPSGYEIGQRSRSTVDPLENGAEVGSVSFRNPIDGTWTPTEVEMHNHFPIQVGLRYPVTHDPAEYIEPREVLSLLELCVWSARMVLTIFQPALSHPRRPPLPVTVALPPFLEN